MQDIDAGTVLNKILFDGDVQIPHLLILLDPKMREDVYVQAYEAFRYEMKKRFPRT